MSFRNTLLILIFAGTLIISRKKSRHISRVFIFLIWVQRYFLRELIFAKMKKENILFRDFIIILHFLGADHKKSREGGGAIPPPPQKKKIPAREIFPKSDFTLHFDRY